MCLLPNLYKVFSGVLLMEVQFWCFATLLKSHFCIQACNFIKRETLAQVFSCEFYEIFKNTFLTEHLRWLLLTFYSESTLRSFRTSCSKQEQYLKFKLTVTSWKYSRSNKFSLLCCRFLDSFNENVHHQRDLDKYFLERFLLVSTFSC